MATIKKKLSALQQLRKKLYPIRLSEDIEKSKKEVDWREVIKLAKAVKRTFKNENIAQPRPSL